MVKIEITVDNPILNDLVYLSKKIGGNAGLPATDTAFKNQANKIADAWRAYAVKKESIEGVPEMKHASNNYMEGVKVKKESAFSYTISNESPAAPLLEYGTTGYDMKKTHPYGKKSRVSKDGIPYLIVPFSWGTVGTVTSFSNTMTESIEDIAKRLKKSKVLEETKLEDNFSGESIERHTYDWGNSISIDNALQGDMENINAIGMVRMANKTRGSTYFTFRVISARSSKNNWINKGIPARHVTEGLKNKYMKDVEEEIKKAMEIDIT